MSYQFDYRSILYLSVNNERHFQAMRNNVIVSFKHHFQAKNKHNKNINRYVNTQLNINMPLVKLDLNAII